MSTLIIADRSFAFSPPASLIDIIEDTSPLKSPVPFGCYAGHCAACMVRIERGAELLNPITPFERYTLSKEELDDEVRLGCQIQALKAGVVRLRPLDP